MAPGQWGSVLDDAWYLKMTNGSDLKREVDRLTYDLQQACQEKVQAAEYGLAVLEEKQKLQETYDDLQNAFEKTKSDLSQAAEV